jgi:hypothetical protein
MWRCKEAGPEWDTCHEMVERWELMVHDRTLIQSRWDEDMKLKENY